jgi:hypothetical protein
VPVPERTIVRDSGGVRVIGSTNYRDLSSGFYILPRLIEGKVVLEISPQGQTMKQEGTIQFQTAVTRITGKLGEWIEIGGVERFLSEKKTEVVARDKGETSEGYGMFVKVEEAR